MSVRTIFAAVIAIGIPLAAAAAAPVSYVPVPRGGAVILNTGSTNTIGYRISVAPSGDVWYVVGDREPQRARIDGSLAETFFAHLRAAMPLSRLTPPHCMKSASFGSSTFVWWHGRRSPDISCPGDPKGDALYADAGKIAAALHLSNTARPIMLPSNEPRRPLPPSPAATP